MYIHTTFTLTLICAHNAHTHTHMFTVAHMLIHTHILIHTHMLTQTHMCTHSDMCTSMFTPPRVLRMLDVSIYCPIAPIPSPSFSLTLSLHHHIYSFIRFAHFCFIPHSRLLASNLLRHLLWFTCAHGPVHLRLQNLAFLYGFALSLLQICSFFLYQVENPLPAPQFIPSPSDLLLCMAASRPAPC